jgi:alanine racemase
VRIGGGLHGLVAGEIRASLGLRRSLSLKTSVAALRNVPAGTPVGYGAMHVCDRESTLALLPCGYADGLHRANWSGGDVLVRGRRAPIVGLVSMNQVVVDVTGVDGVVVGDEVVLIGEQDGVALEAEERCRHGSSPYEVCIALHPSLPRVLRGALRPGAGRIPPAS